MATDSVQFEQPATMPSVPANGRRMRLVMGTTVMLIVYALFWVFSFAAYGAWREVLLLGLEILVTVGMLVLVWRRPTFMVVVGNIITALLLCGIAIANHATGGLEAANVVPFVLVPVVAQVCLGTRGLWWLAPTLLVVGVFEWASARGYEFPNVIPAAAREVDKVFTSLGALIALALIVYGYERVRRSWEEKLQQERDVASKAAAARSRFLASMSHEFRTPLNVIMGNAELVAESLEPGPRRERLQTIAKNAYCLLGMVEDALDMARLDAGRLEINVAPFDPAGLAREVAATLELRAANKGLQLQVVDERQWKGAVGGDAFRLRQILLNLLDNAIKFADQGRVLVTLRDEQSGWLEVAVADGGRGIPADQRQQVFQPFFSGRDSPPGREGSTGLGLAICRQVASALGGKIFLADEQGRGACFVVHLPFPPWLQKATSDDGGRVLIVEDDVASRELTCTVLERAGYHAVTVSRGSEALDLLGGKHQVSLVLVDLGLPDIDGIDLARSIRELPGGRELPLLALTAHALPETRDACLAAGMNDFVTKPVEAAALVESVRRWIGVPDRREVAP